MKRETREWLGRGCASLYTSERRPFEDVRDSLAATDAEVRALRAEVRRKDAALRKYGGHSEGCLSPLFGVDQCRCGYFAALRPLRKGKKS